MIKTILSAFAILSALTVATPATAAFGFEIESIKRDGYGNSIVYLQLSPLPNDTRAILECWALVNGRATDSAITGIPNLYDGMRVTLYFLNNELWDVDGFDCMLR